jgi:putative transposase
LKTILVEVIGEHGAWLQALEVMPGHVHVLVEVDPQFSVHRLVKALKGRSSRVLRQDFVYLRRRLPTLWTNAYFVASTGGASLAAIRRYLESVSASPGDYADPAERVETTNLAASRAAVADDNAD